MWQQQAHADTPHYVAAGCYCARSDEKVKNYAKQTQQFHTYTRNTYVQTCAELH